MLGPFASQFIDDDKHCLHCKSFLSFSPLPMTNPTSNSQSERDIRIAKAHALRAIGINPYAQKFDKTSMI
jgi:hypothetical protein